MTLSDICKRVWLITNLQKSPSAQDKLAVTVPGRDWEERERETIRYKEGQSTFIMKEEKERRGILRNL